MQLLRLICIFFIFLGSPLSAKKRYVSAEMIGELGNQISMISNALALAWDTNAEATFPSLKTRKDCNIPLNRREFFFRLKTDVPRNVHWKPHKLTYFHTPIRPSTHTLLTGWGFDPKYYSKYRGRLQKVFAPSKAQIQAIKKGYPELFNGDVTIGVHIRLCHNNVTPFCGYKYYKAAAQQFPDDALFVIGSNRPEWVKKHLKQLFPNKRVLILEGNLHTTDFNILRLCNHNILSGGTFSYWLAYLSTQKDKKVVAPSLWYSTEDYRTKMGYPGNSKKHPLYPGDWTVIQVPKIRYVPGDIRKFASSSVNS